MERGEKQEEREEDLVGYLCLMCQGPSLGRFARPTFLFRHLHELDIEESQHAISVFVHVLTSNQLRWSGTGQLRP